MSSGQLSTVLIVEDEALIAIELEEIAASAGWAVVTVASHEAGRAALECSAISFALVDGTPQGRAEFAFARLLKARGIKFAFCTGAPISTFPDDFKDAVVIVKPYAAEEIEAALQSALA